MCSGLTCSFVVIGGGISGVSCAEHLSVLCPKETIVLITASDVVKATCNLKKFGKTLEEFDVEERSASLVFQRSPNVVIVQSPVTAFNPEGSYTRCSMIRSAHPWSDLTTERSVRNSLGRR